MKNRLVEKSKKAKYAETKRYMWAQLLPAVTASDCLNPIPLLGDEGVNTPQQRVSRNIFGRSLDIAGIFQYKGPSGGVSGSDFWANGMGYAVVYCTEEVATSSPPTWADVFGNSSSSASEGQGFRPYGKEYKYVVLKRDYVVFDWETDEVLALDGTIAAHTVTGSQTEQYGGNNSAISLSVPAQTIALVGAASKNAYKHKHFNWHLNLDGLKTDFNEGIETTAIGYLYFIVSTSLQDIKCRTNYVYSYYE